MTSSSLYSGTHPAAAAITIVLCVAVMVSLLVGQTHGYKLTTIWSTNTSQELRVLGVDENDRVLYWKDLSFAIFALDVETGSSTVYAGNKYFNGNIYDTSFLNARFKDITTMCEVGNNFYILDNEKLKELNRDTQQITYIAEKAFYLICDDVNREVIWMSIGSNRELNRFIVANRTTIVSVSAKKSTSKRRRHAIPDVYEHRILLQRDNTDTYLAVSKDVFYNEVEALIPKSGIPVVDVSPSTVFRPTRGKYYYVYAGPGTAPAGIECSWLRYDRSDKLTESRTDFPLNCSAGGVGFEEDLSMHQLPEEQSGAASLNNSRFYFAERNRLGYYAIRYLSDFPEDHLSQLVAAPSITTLPPLTPAPIPPATPVPTPAPTTDPGTLALGTFASTARSDRALTILGVDGGGRIFFASNTTKAVWQLNPATGAEEIWAGDASTAGHNDELTSLPTALFTTPAHMCTRDYAHLHC